MDPPQSPLPILSKGEWACLRLAAQHLDSAQIAHRVGYSPSTVDAYLSRASRKLGANGRRHAIQILQRDHPDLFNEPEFKFVRIEPGFGARLKQAVSWLPWPWPTDRNPRNDRPLIQKALMLAIAASILMLGAAAYLAILIRFNTGL